MVKLYGLPSLRKNLLKIKIESILFPFATGRSSAASMTRKICFRRRKSPASPPRTRRRPSLGSNLGCHFKSLGTSVATEDALNGESSTLVTDHELDCFDLLKNYEGFMKTVMAQHF